jgi:hypothetical protein
MTIIKFIKKTIVTHFEPKRHQRVVAFTWAMRIPRLYGSFRNRSGEEGMPYEREFKGFIYSEEGLFPWSSLASSWTGGMKTTTHHG